MSRMLRLSILLRAVILATSQCFLSSSAIHRYGSWTGQQCTRLHDERDGLVDRPRCSLAEFQELDNTGFHLEGRKLQTVEAEKRSQRFIHDSKSPSTTQEKSLFSGSESPPCHPFISKTSSSLEDQTPTTWSDPREAPYMEVGSHKLHKRGRDGTSTPKKGRPDDSEHGWKKCKRQGSSVTSQQKLPVRPVGPAPLQPPQNPIQSKQPPRSQETMTSQFPHFGSIPSQRPRSSIMNSLNLIIPAEASHHMDKHLSDWAKSQQLPSVSTKPSRDQWERTSKNYKAVEEEEHTHHRQYPAELLRYFFKTKTPQRSREEMSRLLPVLFGDVHNRRNRPR